MDSKIFNIPFRSRSTDSDFICRDGELDSTVGGVEGESVGELEGLIPDIEFGIIRDTLKGWHLNPDVFPTKTLVASEPSMEYWNKLAAKLLEQFQSEAAYQRLFVAPFYAMAAWKTYAGAYLAPTSPQILVPNSKIPVVSTDGDTSSQELDFRVAAALGNLHYRLQTPETLRSLVGKVKSLVIFVSEPLQKYKTYGTLLPVKHVTTDNYCESLDLSTGLVSPSRVCTQTLNMAWVAPETGISFSVNDTTGSVFSENTQNLSFSEKMIPFLPFAEIPLSSMAPDDKPLWTPCADYAIPLNRQTLGYDEILSGGGAKGGDLCIIEGTGEKINVLTRPIKLSDAGKLKRVSRVFLRGNYSPSSIVITVYASRDMLKWWSVAKTKGGTVSALPRSPFRFFKIGISGILSQGENLQGISFITT